MQGESASSCGVILPMLIIQIQGYVIGLLAFIFVIFNEIFHILPDSVLVLIITLFIHSIVVVFISIITGLVSKMKNKIIIFVFQKCFYLNRWLHFLANLLNLLIRFSFFIKPLARLGSSKKLIAMRRK